MELEQKWFFILKLKRNNREGELTPLQSYINKNKKINIWHFVMI